MADELDVAEGNLVIGADFIRYVHPGHVLGGHRTPFARTRTHWILSGQYALDARRRGQRPLRGGHVNSFTP